MPNGNPSYGDAFGLSPGMGQVNQLPLRYQMGMQMMGTPNMYQQPYRPPIWQQVASMGASLAGYQGLAMPYSAPGTNLYDNVYQARYTTPLFNTMQSRFNQQMGGVFATSAAQALENMGMIKPGDRDRRYNQFINAGTSPMGQFVAQMAQQSPIVQNIMGGDISQTWQTMFGNRNLLSSRPGQLINPENKIQQRMAAEYTTMLMQDMTRRVYSDASGRNSLVPNVAITGGRDVAQIGNIATMMSAMDPKSRGMSKEVYDIMGKATSENRRLNGEEYRRVAESVKKYNDKLEDTLKGLSAIGDALGEADLGKVAEDMNQALQGGVFQLGQGKLTELGQRMSAAQKVYGISPQEQLAMMTSLGNTYAGVSGAVNPITGRADIKSLAHGSYMFNEYAMAMAANNGMSAEDALAYTNAHVRNAGASTAGRLSQLIEAGYRTGQINQTMYGQFHTAALAGDTRKQQALVSEMGQLMGRNLFADIKDPARMRLAMQQLDNLSPEEAVVAQQQMARRILAGPEREMRQRAVEQNLSMSVSIGRGVLSRAGVRESTAMNREDRDAATMAGYKGYLKSQIETAATPEARAAAEQKLALLEAGYKRGGITQVKSMLQMDTFRADRGAMELQAKQAQTERFEQGTMAALGEAGTSKKWLEQASRGADRDTRKEIMRAMSEISKDPTRAKEQLQKIYSKLPSEMRQALGDPSKMLEGAKKLADPAMMERISTELAKQQAEGKNVRWADVAKQMTGATDDVVNSADAMRRSQVRRESAMYQQRLNDPQMQQKITEIMQKDPSMSFSDAAEKAMGTSKGAVKEYMKEAQAMAAVQMGYASEIFSKAPDVNTRARYAAAVSKQMQQEGALAKSNQNLKLTALQRVTKYMTQDPRNKEISLLDVMGISTGQRVMATDVQAELASTLGMTEAGDIAKGYADLLDDKRFKSLQARAGKDQAKLKKLDELRAKAMKAEGTAQLEVMNKTDFLKMSEKEVRKLAEKQGGDADALVEMHKTMRESQKTVEKKQKTGEEIKAADFIMTGGKNLGMLGSGAITADSLKATAQADKLNTAMQKALQSGDTSALSAFADEQARAGAGGKRHWWGGTTKRYDQLKGGIQEELLRMASSGKQVSASDMPAVMAKLEREGQASALRGDKGKGGTGRDTLRVTLESSQITIDMGGKQMVGTIGGEGTGRY